ncbi:acyltransferase [bacterium]|nr:acyltransferase [bacterium]
MKNFLNWIGCLLSKTYKYKDGHFVHQSYIRFFIWQRVFRINAKAPWPVHFTSYVTGIENIKIGKMCSPGSNIGQYIQANSRIIMGDNVLMGPGSKIISANHDMEDFTKHIKGDPIIIGSNVWIGADVIILPEVTIGENVIIGAGSIVTRDIPSNSIAVGNPCKVIKKKTPYKNIHQIST